MKKIIRCLCCTFFVFTLFVTSVNAEEGALNKELYATAAVLMDADTGRVLYGKSEDVPLAMASTTKIMTCILILENGELEDEVQISSYAASMPKVKLYVKKGETYKVKDLLYSLMLESHNDSAVALAEYLGRRYLSEELQNKSVSEYTAEESKAAVEAFAQLMNQKAEELGCADTCFVTPNGLDATRTITGENGAVIQKEHHTTATELAKIMAYCIKTSTKREEFLQITRTPSYGFGANGRSFSCNNHNAFLNMMEGALSGKTGFTNKAGYCYVGALERDGRTYTLALLGCGWPNNKNYKWSDAKKLFGYGLEHYQYREYTPETNLQPISVKGGAAADGNPFHGVSVILAKDSNLCPVRLLTKETEQVVAHAEIEKNLVAPVETGRKVGVVTYYLIEEGGAKIYLGEEGVYTAATVEKIDFLYLLRYIFRQFVC